MQHHKGLINSEFLPSTWGDMSLARIAVPVKAVKNRILFHSDSERIMGSVSLQPDMRNESTDLQLEENFLKQLKEKYCCKVKVRSSESLCRDQTSHLFPPVDKTQSLCRGSVPTCLTLSHEDLWLQARLECFDFRYRTSQDRELTYLTLIQPGTLYNIHFTFMLENTFSQSEQLHSRCSTKSNIYSRFSSYLGLYLLNAELSLFLKQQLYYI